MVVIPLRVAICGCDKIYRLPIRSEYWTVFHLLLCSKARVNQCCMSLRIIYKDVGFDIEILDSLFCTRMEDLLRLIGTESDVFPCWMPTWEHHRTAKGVVSRFHIVILSVMTY